MKLEKITHDHLLTKWLKVIIFAILMLAPIFSVAIRCAYVVCNKNAYQSYSGYNIETNNELATSIESSLNYESYFYNYTGNLSTDNTTAQTWYEGNKNNIAYISITAQRIYFYDNNFTTLDYWGLSSSTPYAITFTALNNSALRNNDIIYRVYQQQVGNSLDNVFDYSVNELKNDQLFNWTQNTGIYTGVNAMTTGLGLTDGTIAILITYWTLLSIIYVIIDIVLEGFVALTHMILKKAS